MSREWKPGDVALVDHGGAGEARAIRTDLGGWACARRGSDGRPFHHENDVLPARPLVVIDPEDREQVERLTTEYVKTWLGPREATSPESVDQMQAALREFADPKPVEVFEHFVIETNSKPLLAACGKVWTPSDNTVAERRCTTCAAIVDKGWTK